MRAGHARSALEGAGCTHSDRSTVKKLTHWLLLLWFNMKWLHCGWVAMFLHTIAVLKAYRADILKDSDNSRKVSPDTVLELHRTLRLPWLPWSIIFRLNFWAQGEEQIISLMPWSGLPRFFSSGLETVVQKFMERKVKSTLWFWECGGSSCMLYFG